MAEETLTIAFTGTLTINDFAEAIKTFSALIAALTEEIAGRGMVEWEIDNLQYGSAITTLRGRSETPEQTQRIVLGYSQVGESLENDQPIPYGKKVRDKAKKLQTHIARSITGIRFETQYKDSLISTNTSIAMPRSSPIVAYGQVRGKVQTLSDRGKLRFVIYDNIFDKPIACYLTEDQKDMITGAWGQKVIVRGKISRDPETYRPIAVRNIQDITLIKENIPGSYVHARGILSVDTQDPQHIQEAFRRMRDEW